MMLVRTASLIPDTLKLFTQISHLLLELLLGMRKLANLTLLCLNFSLSRPLLYELHKDELS